MSEIKSSILSVLATKKTLLSLAMTPIILAGCGGGSDGAQGPQGPQGERSPG